jgi:TIR domain
MFLQRFQYVDLRDAFPSMLDDIVARVILPTITSNLVQPISPRIFLCHAKEDAPRVEKLYFALGKAGFDPWYDKRDLVVGDLWEKEIREAIKNSE